MSDGTTQFATAAIRGFRRRVRAHHRAHGRHALPWRLTADPYRILVSEVMLQQTQAPRVAAKYEFFLRRFPSVSALAEAPRREVLLAWQGLGYNRRALMLQEAARRIRSDHGGRVPSGLAELRSLPGVGPYTAAAVRIFAFNQAETCIETNIRSVFIHEFFPNHDRVPDRLILPLVERTLDHRNPRMWYGALMDYGSALKQRIPNPSRKSATHVRQSAFRGSARYARGRVLAYALRARRRSFSPGEAVAAAPVATPATVRRALAGLVRERILIEKRGRYQLAE